MTKAFESKENIL